MSTTTSIAWTDKTWNPTLGCSRVSAGCENCYAERVAHRGMTPAHQGLTVAGKKGPRWNGTLRLMHDRLGDPLKWRKPCRVFVNSMSDLFHPEVPFEFIAKVWAVMLITSLHETRGGHTYQILTKRPQRMLEVLRDARFAEMVARAGGRMMEDGDGWSDALCHHIETHGPVHSLIWLGVSAENQETADERIPLLLRCPAAVHWVSAEPLLGPINLAPWIPDPPGFDPFAETGGGKFDPRSLDSLMSHLTAGPVEATGIVGHKLVVKWIVVGGESGPGARPCNVEWIRDIVAQCKEAGVPAFVKQLGATYIDALNGIGGFSARAPADLGVSIRNLKDRKGGDMSEWPEDLRVREFPEVTS